ncbi:hypothetical protein P875_00127847 [Aspergillus parasiticus SU-1]|uniref:BTB domain-containing protein n=1 Tax=Aspergillus parasiticus (strain ATCC 56775 / NRRL 5862 / SRRC 143 / SU-1) TaxID=1403190 RepID=A0A0F0IHW9_ASPPU|nr:hypothetical protein P875_00127847 [Aspergillus parasiticus SU-1]
MDQPSHIIDPDGEVTILLRNTTLSRKSKKRKKSKKDKKKRSVSSLVPVHPSLEPTQPATEEPAQEPAVEVPVEEPPDVPIEEPAVEMPIEELAVEIPVEEPAIEEPIEEPAVEMPLEELAVEMPLEELAVEIPVEEPATEMPVEVPVREQIETDLVREPLDETYFRIQVSAKHLILASPVFKKILTGGWKESVTYLQKGSVEITAESWDIEALLILLHAIHGQQYHVPRKLTLEMLAKVAVLVDYYDCKESVYIWSTIWIDALEEKIPETYSRDLLLWLWISCIFQLPAQFKESTSTVMSWSDGWITSLEFPIPSKVMEAINKHREEAINNLVTLLHDTCEALLSGTRGCCFECSSIMYGALTKEMRLDVVKMTDNRQKEYSNARKADIGIVLTRAEIVRLNNAGQKSKDKRAALDPGRQSMIATGDSAKRNRAKQYKKEDREKEREKEDYTKLLLKETGELKEQGSSRGADS